MIKYFAERLYPYSDYLKEKGKNISRWDEGVHQGGIGHLKKVIEFIQHYKEKEGLIIGIFGDWGTGKSSLLRGLDCYYSDMLNMPLLYFEAWRYQREENPLVPLLVRLSSLKPMEDIKDSLLQIARAITLGTLDIGARIISGGKIDISSVKEYSNLADELSEQRIKRASLYDTLHNILREKIAKVLGEQEENRFFLVIDDLDRCLPDKAVFLLETLRFHFQVDRTVIVLGLNDYIVGRYIEDQYRMKNGNTLFDGKDFLRKLVHWSIELPRVKAEQMASYLFDEEKDKEALDVFAQLDPVSYRTWLRMANRYYILVKDGIDKKYAAFEVIISECFPEMEQFLRNRPEVRNLMASKPLEMGKSELLPEIAEFFNLADRQNIFDQRGKIVTERIKERFKRP